MNPFGLDRDTLTAWRNAAPGFLRRQVKHVGQARYGWTRPGRVTFVFGCQRSGTKMVMRVLDQSPATRIYHENHHSAFHDFQLRSDRTIRALVRLSPAPAQVLKPICDSHRADELLANFPAARGLWIYRDPDDVANSAVQKWGDHQREVIAAVAEGRMGRWGWRTERLPPEVITAVQRVYRPDLTPQEGALLFWYLRNSFFFSLGVDAEPRMRLVRYGRLVGAPRHAFAEVFEHVGVPFSDSFVDDVRASSVRRNEPPRASPEIRRLCAELMARLEAWTPIPTPTRPLVSPVLLLINTLGTGGAERYVVTVANWLADRGVKVTVAATGGTLVADLREDVCFEKAPLHKVRGDMPRAVKRVRAIIATHKPAVIVGNSLVVTWVARLSQVRRQIPIINVAHGWPADRYRQVGPLMRIADAVVAVSPDVKARLVEGGMDPDRCAVVYNGVDCTGLGPRTGPSRDAARHAMGAGPEHILITVVGRTTAQKAHHHVVTIAQQLRETHPALRFAIVGSGERDAELAELVASAGVADRVTLVGLRRDVPELLGSADIYMNCSDWEGMPLTTIEAMASGLPVVATRTEGSDQLLDPSCGVVVPIGDVSALSAAVVALAADSDRRAQMGVAGRARALSQFSHDRMVRELASVITDVCGS